MEYLRAIISSDTRGPLYKKDFEVQKVFDQFVRSYVSTLINAGVIYERELYSALIIPGYGRYQHLQPKFTVEDKAIEDKKRRWITLAFVEPVQPDKPMDFFAVELRLVDRPLVYRDNFQLFEVAYFWRSIERALAQIDVLGYQEQRGYSLFARNDEQFDFDREELYTWQKEANDLVEIVQQDDLPVSTASAFPRKSIQDFSILNAKRLLWGKLVEDVPEQVIIAGKATQPEVQILITYSALESLQQIARSHIWVEFGGMLIGHICENADNPGYIVEITDHIPAEGALASEIELRITFEAWQRQTILLKEQYPGKRIVGWYHTHLDLVKRAFYTDETQQSMYTSSLFFSQDDLFLHRHFFREKWYVAMVLDSESNLVFFQWEGNDVSAAQKFYVIESESKSDQ